MMKKILFTVALCYMTCASVMLAQDNTTTKAPRNMNARNMNAVPVQMLADTTISNHIGLSEAQMEQINVLNKAYVEKVRTAMKSRPDRGSKMDDKTRETFQKLAADSRNESLKDLRKIMGDDKYIEYLEKSLDKAFLTMTTRHSGQGGLHGGIQGGGPRNGQGGGPRAGQGSLSSGRVAKSPQNSVPVSGVQSK